jgi:hypothetical protein
MAGIVVADTLQADSTSTLVLKNGVANTPPTIQDSAGTQIGTFCRAFVNFNGTTNVGGFCTIRASFNVTSVADNGTGDYTVNFTTAMPDADYAVVGTSNGVAGATIVGLQVSDSTTPTASLVRVNTQQGATLSDRSRISVAIFR